MAFVMEKYFMVNGTEGDDQISRRHFICGAPVKQPAQDYGKQKPRAETPRLFTLHFSVIGLT